MKVVIAGPRDWYPGYDVVNNAVVLSKFKITEVVDGGATGVDLSGRDWALVNNIKTSGERFWIRDWEWKFVGPSIGPIRNKAMAHYADAVLIIRNKHSRGTNSMIVEAKKRKLPIYYHDVCYVDLR